MHEIEAKSILSARNGMNVYRGCTHGCIYCDARSLCYGMEHAFEDVAVKRSAPALLEDALRRRRARCMIGTGAMSDPYQPLEDETRLTRRCLEVIERYGFGAAIQTKSDRILRDLDLLTAIHRKAKCVVQMTLTTYDEALCRILEPNVCTTRRRFETLCALRDAGIPTVVWLSPVLPFLTDTAENLRGILGYCFAAGVRGIVCFGMGVTLRAGDREYFYRKLDAHFPGMKERYIRAYGTSYECASPREAELMAILRRECATHGVLCEVDEVFAYLHAFDDPHAGEQMSLFD